MSKVTVFGGGMVGSAMAFDLAKEHDVLVADRDANVLAMLKEAGLQTEEADLSDKEQVLSLIEDADVVVGAVPGFMGYQTVRSVIEAGKDIVDISFFPEDPFGLDELAKEKGVVAVVDCGVAPGLSHMIAGYHNANEKVDSFRCLVGGLPKHPEPPFYYKAPFSPVDVIEEYTRPARIRKDGEDVVVEALSGIEETSYPETGLLESFYSDGLRTLLQTMDIPNMEEKTLRFPGHAKLMKSMRDAGFFSEEKREVKGSTVRPIDLTSEILFDQWKLEPSDVEFTVMEVEVSGEKDHRYLLYDERGTDGVSSMSRTTGYTCTAAVELVLSGKYSRKGISPPEYIGAEEGCFQEILKYLEERGINLQTR